MLIVLRRALAKFLKLEANTDIVATNITQLLQPRTPRLPKPEMKAVHPTVQI